MNHRHSHLDDRGHALALAAFALLALVLAGAPFVDAAVFPTQAELRAVYSDEVAAGVLLYRLPGMTLASVDGAAAPDAAGTCRAPFTTVDA